MSVELSYEIHKGGGSVAAVGREKKNGSESGSKSGSATLSALKDA